MRVKALKKMYYARREYQTGETYAMDDREEQEARTLALLGHIEILPAVVEKERASSLSYQTAAVTPEADKPAEPVAQIEAQEEPPKRAAPKREYKRRDMRPQK